MGGKYIKKDAQYIEAQNIEPLRGHLENRRILLLKTTKLPLPDTSDARMLPNPNHIGSSTFLTDFVGQPTAYVLYLPYGVTERYEVKL